MAARAQKTSVLRISSSLADTAEKAGSVFHRKAAQQIEYWASLGRALEAMPGVSHQNIEAALAARTDFDALNAEERAIALARIAQEEASRQEPAMKPPEGGLYSRDEKGRLVRVLRDGSREIVKNPLRPVPASRKHPQKP